MASSAPHVVPDLLAEARSRYRRSMPAAPSPSEILASRADHFAAGVRYAMDHPASVRRLHSATGLLLAAVPLDTWLARLLEGVLALARADFAAVQLLDPAGGTLRMVAYSGLSEEFAASFRIVEADRSACGRAVRSGRQVVVPDVGRDASFAPYATVAARAGFRSVQSTPLLDHTGRLVGVLSTHWRRRHAPSTDDLELLHLYADYAGERLAHLLSLDKPGGQGVQGRGSEAPEVDVIARAMLAALLTPPEGRCGLARDLEDAPAERLAAVAAVADAIVSDLFTVGLLLDGAVSLACEEPVTDRISAASVSVERVIGRVRDLMIAYAESDRPADPPAGGPAAATTGH